MGRRRLNNWRWWLQTVPLGLVIVAPFAPETLGKILLGVALVGMLVFQVTDSSASRKWLLRSLIPIAVFILLAVLFSFGRAVVLFGVLGIWAATTLWEFYAEYLAHRDRRQRLPESN